MRRRVSAIEEYVEKRVEERMEQEVSEILDRIGCRLPCEEFRRVLEIVAGGEAGEEHRGA